MHFILVIVLLLYVKFYIVARSKLNIYRVAEPLLAIIVLLVMLTFDIVS